MELVDGSANRTELCEQLAMREYELDNLKEVNAKLRELCRDLWAISENHLLCDENCPYGEKCDWWNCVYEQRMRELGVEVE